MYDEELLERSMHPEFRGEIDGIEPILLFNASCGDELRMYLKVSKGVVLDGRFAGRGCAIALASADTFIASIKGKTVDEAKRMSEEFSKMIVGGKYSEEKLGKAKCMSCVSRMPARVKCAKLAWESLDKLA